MVPLRQTSLNFLRKERRSVLARQLVENALCDLVYFGTFRGTITADQLKLKTELMTAARANLDAIAKPYPKEIQEAVSSLKDACEWRQFDGPDAIEVSHSVELLRQWLELVWRATS